MGCEPSRGGVRPAVPMGITKRMCRPPGFADNTIRIRWLTPPAKMFRPLGCFWQTEPEVGIKGGRRKGVKNVSGTVFGLLGSTSGPQSRFQFEFCRSLSFDEPRTHRQKLLYPNPKVLCARDNGRQWSQATVNSVLGTMVPSYSQKLARDNGLKLQSKAVLGTMVDNGPKLQLKHIRERWLTPPA
jgi:hypothetical protein